MKSISTLMYTVWHVDKYKISFKLVINWTNEILQHIVVSSGLSWPGIIDARARRLRNTVLGSHTDVDEAAGLLECFAVSTSKQLLNLMLDLEDEGTTIHQNIS